MASRKKSAPSPSANPMWGGHFKRGPSKVMEAINPSIAVDWVLYKHDIAASIAHAGMLAKQKILTDTEAETLIQGLHAIEKEIADGAFAFKPALEDIHMNVEARLKELVGEVAGKLHTARSRNDQVATDFRLWVRDAADKMGVQLECLREALLTRAEEHAETIMPGFTHLQTAQPITLGHHLLAYAEMFARDAARFSDARARLNESPLGACALAGTSFPIDRHMTAQALGFAHPMRNSLDAVSARDFALECLSAGGICAVHLSRLAEEFVLWSSKQFGYITFSDALTSGSSIMPQKRNPDAAELVRGKTGRVIGNLVSLITVMKGLPLAYNKDTQEDKEPVFDSFKTLSLSLEAMAEMVLDFKANTRRLHEDAMQGFSTATDLADWLVRQLHLPFRNAHHITSAIVQMAEEKACRLDQLSLKELQRVEPRITRDIFQVLSVEQSVASRTSFGGTAPANVKKAINAARKSRV